MQKLIILIGIISLSCLNVAICQWNTNGSHIYNTNSGFVGIGTDTPLGLLYVMKNTTEPMITIRNTGGAGGASYSMIDDASGADWKFKATTFGGFKIRDHANGLDVFVIEPNSAVHSVYIKSGGNVGIGTSSPAGSALVDLTSITKGLLPPRMTASQRVAIGSPAAGLLVFQTDVPSGYYYYTGTAWTTISTPKHYIGELYGGGIVFFVYDNGEHGLISSTADIGGTSNWGGNTETFANGNGFGAGQSNTILIIAYYGAMGGSPARNSANLTITSGGINYGDWYLPSQYELNLLYDQKTVVGGFNDTYYWTSTEVSASTMKVILFTDGTISSVDKGSFFAKTRAIRAF